MSLTEVSTHKSLPLKNCGGPTTQFFGMIPYVDIRLAYDVLNLVDPCPQFPVFEQGHGVVRRGLVTMSGQELRKRREDTGR